MSEPSDLIFDAANLSGEVHSWLCFEECPIQEYRFEVISCPRVENTRLARAALMPIFAYRIFTDSVPKIYQKVNRLCLSAYFQPNCAVKFLLTLRISYASSTVLLRAKDIVGEFKKWGKTLQKQGIFPTRWGISTTFCA